MPGDDKQEWEYADAMKAVREWATSWLEPETQEAWIVGPADLIASASRQVEDAALALGWWQDADGGWNKPVGRQKA